MNPECKYIPENLELVEIIISIAARQKIGDFCPCLVTAHILCVSVRLQVS